MKNVDMTWKQILLLDNEGQILLGVDMEGRVWCGAWDWEDDQPRLTWTRTTQEVLP